MEVSCDVAIVGAGLAGLAAAEELVSKGHNVKIIEAEDRAGGRVHSHYLPNGAYLELGAFYFTRTEETIDKYIERYGLVKVEHPQHPITTWFGDWKGNTEDKATFLEGEERDIKVEELINHYVAKAGALDEDIPFLTALQKVGASKRAIEFLQELSLTGALVDFRVGSTPSVLRLLKVYDGQSAAYTLKGGNAELPKAMAENLKQHILFNHKVQKIEQTPSKCILHGSNFTVEAKRVILTIPLPDMGKITFVPELSKEKQESMQMTSYRRGIELFLVAPPHPTKMQPGIFMASDTTGWLSDNTGFQLDPDTARVIEAEIIITEDKSDEEIEKWKASINEYLIEVYPDWDPNQVEYHLHRQDAIAVNFTCDTAQEGLRKSEGCLHFAGEHTSEKYASMNGAIESGLRAAKEIEENI